MLTAFLILLILGVLAVGAQLMARYDSSPRLDRGTVLALLLWPVLMPLVCLGDIVADIEADRDAR